MRTRLVARNPAAVSTPQTEQSRWFENEVQPHEPALRAYLRRQFPSLRDIDDIVQHAYARILQAHRGGEVGLPRAYLFVTARHAVLDLFRRDRIIFTEAIAELQGSSVDRGETDAAETASHAQELAILDEAIASLPERCRDVFVLRRLHGFSRREIAGRLGISEHTVNAQLAIGIVRCRRFLLARGVMRGHPDA